MYWYKNSRLVSSGYGTSGKGDTLCGFQAYFKSIELVLKEVLVTGNSGRSRHLLP
jgi:hypothetical protein